jgi:hypothetical protein
MYLRLLFLLLFLAFAGGCGGVNSTRTSTPGVNEPTDAGTPFFIWAPASTPSFNVGIATFKAERSTGKFQNVGFLSLFQDSGRLMGRLRLDPTNRIVVASSGGIGLRPGFHQVLAVDSNTGSLELRSNLPFSGESDAGFFDPEGQFLFFLRSSPMWPHGQASPYSKLTRTLA